jgi:autotransporter translocation and assembly factor TamB
LKRLFRVAGIGVVALVGLLAAVVLAASVILQGPRLGHLIESALPANRGKLEIGGVTWSLRALVDILTDAPSPITVDGLRILDPEGTVVLDVPHLEARVKLKTLIGGSFSIHDLRVAQASWRFAQMSKEQSIGFLAALAPKTPPPPQPAASATAKNGPGSFFHIVNAELGDLNAVFDFPGVWGLELRHMHATASLIQSAVDPAHPIFGFDAGPVVAEGGGWLRIMDDNLLPFDRVAITRVATTQERPDDIFLDLEGAETGHSRLVAKGFFTGIYGATSEPGIDLHGRIDDAGDALGAVAAGKKIDGLTVGGHGASVKLDLTQSFAKLKVAGAFRGLEVGFNEYRAQQIGFDFGFDAGAGLVDLKRFQLEAPGGGRFNLDAQLHTDTLKLQLDARLHDLRTDSYLPPALRAMGAGRLAGRIVARGNLAKKSVDVSDLDIELRRTRTAPLPPTVRVHGNAHLSPSRVDTSGLTVEVPGASATAKGELDLDRQVVRAALAVLAADLGRVLGDLGLPPLAKDARINLGVTGSPTAPTAVGDAVIHGLGAEGRVLPELKARFSLRDGVARIDDLAGAVFDGTLHASGELRLYERSTRHMLRKPVVALQIAGQDLNLATITGRKDVNGRLSFDGHASGPIDAVTADLHVPARTRVSLLGDDFDIGPIDIALAGPRVEIKRLHVARAGGGALDVDGSVELSHKDLDVNVVLDKLPLEAVAALAGLSPDVALTGTASAKLHVTGTPERPVLAGDVSLGGVSARGIQLGDAHLTLTPVAVSADEGGNDRGTDKQTAAVSIVGDLFDRFHVDTAVSLAPAGPSVHGELTFDRIALETLAPALAAFGDGRGVATGRVAVDIAPGQPLSVDVLLQELALSIARSVEGADGETTVQRVRVAAAKPIHVTVRGQSVDLDDVLLATDGGNLSAHGRIDGDTRQLAGEVSGHLDLELLQPLLGTSVDKLSGDLKVELGAGGTLDKPLLHGAVDVINAVTVRPHGFDTDFVIGGGSFKLDNDGVRVERLALTAEGSTMNVAGRASFGPGFKPEDVRVDLDGDISARLLAYVAPDAVSDAQGTARIRAMVRGTLDKPEVHGRIDLKTIDFRVRDLGTEVQVQSGLVEISNGGVTLHNVRVRLDDGGTLVIGASGVRAGEIAFTSLVPFVPGDVDLPLHGERLTFKSPGTLEVDDLTFDLDLRGNMVDGFGLGGEVRLVSGRYLQDFKMQQLVLSPRVNESSVRPFYEGHELLEGLALDLGVRTVGEGFVVQNNIAPEIHVDVLLNVGGTLSQPVLSGDVRPTDGRFHLPGMRGDFDLVPNVNHVTFIATKSVADGDTPELEIEAQSTVPDATGNDHTVHMRLHGPIREAQIDLSTDDGLDRSQTAMLMLTGRTSMDTSQRFGTANPTVGANINTGADVAGQITRDAVANLMEPYIDDTFQRVTGFNLRLTVGPDGFEGRLLKRVSRYWNLQLDTLLGFQNQSRQTAQADVWIFDYLSIGGGFQRITLSSQLGVPETLPVSGNVELRWDFAIRR